MFFKRGGAAVGSVRGSTGRQCFKISLVNLRGGGGGEIDTRGCDDSPAPLNTPLTTVGYNCLFLLSFSLPSLSSTAALLEGHTPSTTRRFMASRASAALQLHRTRLQGMSHRLALCFLLGLALVLAWIIGYFHASPALLVLLGVASVAIGIGRWQQVVDGAELEAELRARQKSRSQVLGETVEWLNVALHNW